MIFIHLTLLNLCTKLVCAKKNRQDGQPYGEGN